MGGAELAVLIVAAILVIATAVAMSNQQKKLEDPNNTEVVYLDQLPSVSKLLGVGSFRLQLFRQSGNPQQKDQYFKTGPEAVRAATSTFRRAKIDYVVISSNNTDEFCFRRPYHDHRGTKEGKKVGRAEIKRVS
jgi:hypothetical protein